MPMLTVIQDFCCKVMFDLRLLMPDVCWRSHYIPMLNVLSFKRRRDGEFNPDLPVAKPVPSPLGHQLLNEREWVFHCVKEIVISLNSWNSLNNNKHMYAKKQKSAHVYTFSRYTIRKDHGKKQVLFVKLESKHNARTIHWIKKTRFLSIDSVYM